MVTKGIVVALLHAGMGWYLILQSQERREPQCVIYDGIFVFQQEIVIMVSPGNLFDYFKDSFLNLNVMSPDMTSFKTDQSRNTRHISGSALRVNAIHRNHLCICREII